MHGDLRKLPNIPAFIYSSFIWNSDSLKGKEPISLNFSILNYFQKSDPKPEHLYWKV